MQDIGYNSLQNFADFAVYYIEGLEDLWLLVL